MTDVESADLQELRDRLRRGVTLSKMSSLTIVCTHSKTLLRVLRLNGSSVVWYQAWEYAPEPGPRVKVEHLVRLEQARGALLPHNACCTAEVVDTQWIRDTLDQGKARAVVPQR